MGYQSKSPVQGPQNPLAAAFEQARRSGGGITPNAQAGTLGHIFKDQHADEEAQMDARIAERHAQVMGARSLNRQMGKR